jgi:hypothetical protein
MRVGVIYAAGSKIIRRIVVPDHPRELAGHVSQGEALAEFDSDGIPSMEACDAAVLAATGVKPPDPRCVVIDEKGDVVDVLMADPELDAATFPGKTLRLHDKADRGWVYDSGKDEFSRKVTEEVEVATERER